MDLNWTEILTLLVIATVMFGPEKLPEFARKAARVVNHLGRIANDARGQLRAELGPGFDNISLADLNPKTFVAKHLLSAEEKQDFLDIRDTLKGAGGEASAALDTVKTTIEGVRDAEPAAAAASTRTAFDPDAT